MFYRYHVQVTGTGKKIELATRGHGHSKRWKQERGKRTDMQSNRRKDMEKLLCSIIDPVDIFAGTIAHGRKYERFAIGQLEDMCNGKVLHCGFFVCTEYPILAASPDGLISDDTVVELKCPYTARNDDNSNKCPLFNYMPY